MWFGGPLILAHDLFSRPVPQQIQILNAEFERADDSFGAVGTGFTSTSEFVAV